eukprot:16777-Eustigmatos_ZCMA.PRE.1
MLLRLPPQGVLEYEYPGTFRRNRLVHTQHAVVFGSSVNLDSPDLTRHPLIVRATPYKVCSPCGMRILTWLAELKGDVHIHLGRWS